MRHAHGWILAIVAFAGCGEGVPPEDLDGQYRVTERVEGTCEEPLTSGTVSPAERYFELDYTEDSGRPRLEYHTCSTEDSCNPLANQALSFGPAGSGWNGTVATASIGCILRYRERELFPTEGGVEIVQTTYGETDESLTTEECVDQEARDRGRRMPCLTVVETRAERL